jgi:hypothetical protein
MHIGYWYWMMGLGLGLPVALNLVLKWIVVPIRLKGKGAMAISPRREPTLPEKLSPEMREFLGQMVREFRDEGFETVVRCGGTKGPESAARLGKALFLLLGS